MPVTNVRDDRSNSRVECLGYVFVDQNVFSYRVLMCNSYYVNASTVWVKRQIVAIGAVSLVSSLKHISHFVKNIITAPRSPITTIIQRIPNHALETTFSSLISIRILASFFEYNNSTTNGDTSYSTAA